MTQNYVGITGFDFIEFASPQPQALHELFMKLGFSRIKRHSEKAVDYYKQNDIHFLVNQDPGSFASRFQAAHGPSASATGWRVKNAAEAFRIAVERGARPATSKDYPMPAVYGVGDSLIYFVEQHKAADRWEQIGFKDLEKPDLRPSKGFALVDHLTNNVYQGKLEPLAKFYKEVFGFTEVRYFDIKGQETGLLSYALRSPCGSFCIPINEGKEEKSQINEYLREYKGEGIQHIALLCSNVIDVMDKMKVEGLKTLDMDADYYDTVFQRIPHVKEDKEKIRDHNLLVDGDEEGYLIQIFTHNVIGPIFFEFIQRNLHLGFGEGNFGALFRAIERDQKRRGVL